MAAILAYLYRQRVEEELRERRTREATARARHELLLNSAIAAVGILLLLAVVTGNWRNLLLILANVPFALVGGRISALRG